MFLNEKKEREDLFMKKIMIIVSVVLLGLVTLGIYCSANDYNRGSGSTTASMATQSQF